LQEYICYPLKRWVRNTDIGGRILNKNTGKLTVVIIYILLAIGMILVGFPLLYAFGGSFKSTLEFLSGGANILPRVWRWQNYVDAWKLANFGLYTFNSISVAALSVIGVIFTTSTTGYVLSRASFPGKKLIIGAFGFTLFITGVVTLFPIFKICKDLHLINSLWGLILAQIAVVQPVYSILAMSYVNGISKEIDESARIDGCSFFRIYWNIIFPIIKPIIATIALLTFRDAWNNFMMPLAFTLSKPQLRTLTVGVVQLRDQGEGISSWNLMIAGVVMSLAPIMVVYLFLNRFFITGITEGSIKG
jgi:raffinose/stachyose/melibiose transport system permease protein